MTDVSPILSNPSNLSSPASPALSTSDDIVLIDIAAGIGTVTLNRPKARNALSSALSGRLRSAMAEVDADEEVQVIVLTGADPAFCAGVDLKELGHDGGALKNFHPDGHVAVRGPWAPTAKPVIGAINGVAITGGFELALQCDFLVASDRAAFGDTHARVGVLPGWGLSVLLPQAIGVRRALEMSLTGNFIDAAEAHRLGLVNHIVAHESLIPTVRALATDIASIHSRAVSTYLASYRAIHHMTVGDGLQHEAEVNRDYLATFTPAEFETRRTSIVARGRDQKPAD